MTAGEANEAVQRRLPARDDPTAAAYRACGTVASDGDWLLLGAEVSRNLTQAFVMPSDAGHEAWGQARRAPAGGRADFETRRAQALRSAETVDNPGPAPGKAAALRTEPNLGFVEAEHLVRRFCAIARADIVLVRRNGSVKVD